MTDSSLINGLIEIGVYILWFSLVGATILADRNSRIKDSMLDDED